MDIIYSGRGFLDCQVSSILQVLHQFPEETERQEGVLDNDHHADPVPHVFYWRRDGYGESFKKYSGAVISTTFDKYCYVNVRHLPRFLIYHGFNSPPLAALWKTKSG